MSDPRRSQIRRTVFGTLWAAAIFFTFAATKMIKPIYCHAPWFNDPYDTVISFTMFFVPLVVACLLVQVSLCRRSEALSTIRVGNVLRACRVAIGAILVDLASTWLAFALRANSTEWTPSATGVEIGLLVLSTSAILLATCHVARTPRLLTSAQLHDPHGPDWIGDAVTVAKRESHWFGPLRRLVDGVATWTDHVVQLKVRRHLIIAAATVSSIFGVSVFGWQRYREGYFLSVALLAMGLGFCAMYAFLIPTGWYFGLVRSTNPSSGRQRQVLDSSVVACGAAIVALAFRGNLWRFIGTNANSAERSQFALLEGAVIVLAFVVTLVVELSSGAHTRAPNGSRS